MKIKSISSFGTSVEIYDVDFINFREKTQQGMRQRMFEFQAYASDLIPMHEFYNTRFINTDANALGYFFKPPQKWAIIKDCGEWPCTGPLNTLYSFKNTTYIGDRPPYAAPDVAFIPNTPDFS